MYRLATASQTPMHILLVTATPFEIAPLRGQLGAAEVSDRTGLPRYRYRDLLIEVLVTGVGLPLTAFALGSVLARQKYDLALQAGVAGALDPELRMTQVVGVGSERFADLGVEEADGRFTSVFELGLIGADETPFREGRLWINTPPTGDWPLVHAISVNRVHGYGPSIEQLRRRESSAQIETMEGAAFFYACLRYGQPLQALRSISNEVEPRQREKWQLAEAIGTLNEALRQLLDKLSELSRSSQADGL